MFQDGQLFDHLTVARNVGYALRLRRVPDLDRRVDELLELVGLAVVRRAAAGDALAAASGSGSRWPGRSRSSRGCCCSTSRCRRSTPGCASGWPATCAAILRDGRHHRAAGHPRPRRGVRGRRPARGDARRPDRAAGRHRRRLAGAGRRRDRAVPRLRGGARRRGRRPGCCAPPACRPRRPWRCAGRRWRSRRTARCGGRVVSSRLTPEQVRLRRRRTRPRGARRRRRPRRPSRPGGARWRCAWTARRLRRDVPGP